MCGCVRVRVCVRGKDGQEVMRNTYMMEKTRKYRSTDIHVDKNVIDRLNQNTHDHTHHVDKRTNIGK